MGQELHQKRHDRFDQNKFTAFQNLCRTCPRLCSKTAIPAQKVLMDVKLEDHPKDALLSEGNCCRGGGNAKGFGGEAP